MRLSSNLRHLLPETRISKLILLLLIVISLVAIGLAVSNSRYSIGSDAMSYISIAEHYAMGEIKTAVNGYWSPAVSLLMVPLIAIGLSGSLSFAVVNGIASLVIVMVGALVVWIVSRKSSLATVAYVVASTLFTISAIKDFFPDLLLAAWMVVFVAMFIYVDKRHGRGSRGVDMTAGALMGLVGTVGYMTKLYAVPFFVATIALWAIAKLGYFLRNKPKDWPLSKAFTEALRLPVIIVIGFVVFSTPWVVALSLKYDYFTIGSSAAINAAPKFEEPKENKTSQAPTSSTVKLESSNPQASNSYKAPRIAVPPYDTATTTTEDRTPRGEGSVLPKVKNDNALANFIEGRKQGVPLYISNLQAMWPLLLVTVGIVAGWLVVSKRPYKAYSHYYLLVGAFAVYFTGYAALAGHNGGNIRYYWPLMVIGLLLASFAVGDFTRWGGRFGRLLSVCVAAVTVGSIAAVYLGESRELLTPPIKSPIQLAAEDFSTVSSEKSEKGFLSNNGRQNRMFAYYAGGQAYGSLGAGHEFTHMSKRDAMREKGVDYFLHFTDGDDIEFNPSDYGGEVVALYDLGDDFVNCFDLRHGGPAVKCTLYIIKPQYDFESTRD